MINKKIIVKVCWIDHETAKLGIVAPDDVPVDRGEIHDRKVADEMAKANAKKLKNL